jgi:dienelactone hydrolase
MVLRAVSVAFFFLLPTSCAAPDDSQNDVEAVDALLLGDGREFEQAVVLHSDAALSGVANDRVTNDCCEDGDCICRGESPSEQTLDRAGPYRVDRYRLGARFGRRFGGGTVYFPIDAEPPLSAVVMCPGYTALQSSIAAWGPFFASYGIVLLTIDTTTTLDTVPERADQLLDALAELKDENDRAGSPLRSKLSSDRYGLSGWSMGGGGTWLATAQHPEIRSAVTLAGHNATAGGALISFGSRVPTLMLNGANDATILGGLGQSESAYGAIASTTPKLLYVMSGEGHFSWGSPRTNNNASGRYVLAWQKVFLEGDQRYATFLQQRGPRAAEWRTNVQ